MVRNVVMKWITHQTLVLFLKSDCHQDPHDRRDLQRGSWALSTLISSLTPRISDFQLLLLLCVHVVCICEYGPAYATAHVKARGRLLGISLCFHSEI